MMLSVQSAAQMGKSQHNSLNVWRQVLVGNGKSISLVVLYAAAWYNTDVHRDQAALDYYVL